MIVASLTAPAPIAGGLVQGGAETTKVAAGCTPVVEIVKALAWPVFAFVAALVFRIPLARLVRSVGERVTRLSLFSFGVELLPTARPSTGATLDDIKREPSAAQISDSSRMLFEQVQEQTPADYAVMDLGAGEEWLTSRLFVAAAMLERMRRVECLVFIETAAGTDRRLVAVGDTRQLRWALARRYPWLEVAFARAYAEVSPTGQPNQLPAPLTVQSSAAFITSETGGLEPHTAAQLVGRFIAAIQRPATSPPLLPPGAAPPQPPVADPEWVTLKNGPDERSQWVTRALLRELLPEDAFQAWTDLPREAPRAARLRAVLLRRAPFVALVGHDGCFFRLIDRRALLEDVVRGVEQEMDQSP